MMRSPLPRHVRRARLLNAAACFGGLTLILVAFAALSGARLLVILATLACAVAVTCLALVHRQERS